MPVKYEIPPTFQLTFEKSDGNAYQIRTSQVLPVPLTEAFPFFESPENLAEITPDWLEFRVLNGEEGGSVFEGAEFHYTIRWFAVKLRWHTKITEYRPPELFTDVQVRGPYASWEHLHTFTEVPEGTLMRDQATYRIPFGPIGKFFNRFIIKEQMEDIFTYRAVRAAEWAGGNFTRKLAGQPRH